MTDFSVVNDHEASFGDYFALLKPRVMSLVIFTAMVGLLVAPVHVHAVVALVAVLCIAVGAGAAGALNMWYDADIDVVMKRTRSRPIPAGRVRADEALALGLALAGFAVTMLALATNFLAAGLLAFTIFFYAVVYTMWLKRRTPQNIVIGGLAGALPPMVGWAAATGDITWASAMMVALIFMWTPPHFWALDLFVKGDYARAGVPMLTAVRGPRSTRTHILVYTLAMVPVAVGLGFTQIGGPVYLAIAAAMNAAFVLRAIRLWRRTEAEADADRMKAEKKFFMLSLWYLFAHFGALLLQAPPGVPGWSI